MHIEKQFSQNGSTGLSRMHPCPFEITALEIPQAGQKTLKKSLNKMDAFITKM